MSDSDAVVSEAVEVCDSENVAIMESLMSETWHANYFGSDESGLCVCPCSESCIDSFADGISYDSLDQIPLLEEIRFRMMAMAPRMAYFIASQLKSGDMPFQYALEAQLILNEITWGRSPDRARNH